MYPQMPPADVATVQADVAQVDEPSTDAIDCLPDLPMLTIFSYIPLVDLLATIPQVSPKLTDLRAEACRQRTSLILLLGNDAESYFDEYVRDEFPSLPPIDALSKLVFRKKRLLPGATRKLTRNLPNITSLTVVLEREKQDELWEIILLLGAWYDTLTHLVLVFGSTRELYFLQPFINRLSKLTHLTLYAEGCPSRSSSDFDFPVMAQLESFNCNFFQAFKLFAPSIVRYFADNAQARSIDFDSFCDEDIEVLLTLPPSLGRLFKRLPGSAHWKAEHMLRLSQIFQCLTTLDVCVSVSAWPGLPHSLPTVAASLSSLTCLTELQLTFTFATERDRVPLPADTFIAALPTVTCLSVIIYEPLTSHQDLVPLQLEKMVPNLKRFIIKDPLECSVCDLVDRKKQGMEEEEMRQRVACAQQLWAPIRPLFGHLELAQVGFDLDFFNNYTFVTLS